MSLGNRMHQSYVLRNIVGTAKIIRGDLLALGSSLFLAFVIFLGIAGPYLAPYPYGETLYASDGGILRTAEPSLAHPLGTTDIGQDVLSRILIGARPTIATGLLGGLMIITIGASIGVTAGYVGGRVDNALMRFTDTVYSVPLIPFAIVLLVFFGSGYLSSVVIIGLLLWRGNARVLRSQVLQIKQRPFIQAARASGASTPYVIVRHILPNVASMAILFFSLGVGYSIILQAGLAFIGVTSPFVPSWAVMIRNAYNAGAMADAWWWSLPPGILISLTVLSTILLGRRYEEIAGGDQDRAVVNAG